MLLYLFDGESLFVVRLISGLLAFEPLKQPYLSPTPIFAFNLPPPGLPVGLTSGGSNILKGSEAEGNISRRLRAEHCVRLGPSLESRLYRLSLFLLLDA